MRESVSNGNILVWIGGLDYLLEVLALSGGELDRFHPGGDFVLFFVLVGFASHAVFDDELGPGVGNKSQNPRGCSEFSGLRFGFGVDFENLGLGFVIGF